MNEIDNIINKIKIIYTRENIHKWINQLINRIKKLFNQEKVKELIEEKNREIFFKLIKTKSFCDISEKDYIKYYH